MFSAKYSSEALTKMKITLKSNYFVDVVLWLDCVKKPQLIASCDEGRGLESSKQKQKLHVRKKNSRTLTVNKRIASHDARSSSHLGSMP